MRAAAIVFLIGFAIAMTIQLIVRDWFYLGFYLGVAVMGLTFTAYFASGDKLGSGQ